MKNNKNFDLFDSEKLIKVHMHVWHGCILGNQLEKANIWYTVFIFWTFDSSSSIEKQTTSQNRILLVTERDKA